MKNFYFTFGTDDCYPYQGGWVIVQAPNMQVAKRVFSAYYPSPKGYLNCAFVYTEDEFKSTSMSKTGNFGSRCHCVIGPHQELSDETNKATTHKKEYRCI